MQVRLILWSALVASTFVYLAVLALVAPSPTSPLDPTMPFAFAVAAVSSAAASWFLPASIRTRNLRALDLPVAPAEAFSDVPSGTVVFRDPAAARAAAAPALQAAMILALALREAIALFGFVLGFLGAPPTVYAGFFALAWVLLALEFPRASADDAALESAYGARLR